MTFGVVIDGKKWIVFAVIYPIFKNELRSQNRFKMAGTEDRSAPNNYDVETRDREEDLDVCSLLEKRIFHICSFKPIIIIHSRVS